jgi:dephospho-CoA kinase
LKDHLSVWSGLRRKANKTFVKVKIQSEIGVTNFGFFMPIMIGLTGGIGAGKTMVANVFAAMGIPVFNADHAAKELMQNSHEIKEQLIKQFGDKVYENGILNKSYLASVVFSDPYQLELLNAIVHPVTIQAAWDWAKVQTAPYVIKEAALLFESNAVEGLDYVIGVTAPLAIRTQRVMARDQSTLEEVAQRMRNQISDTIKMRLCDGVIVNDNVQLIIPQVLKMHEFILAKLGSSK